MYSIIAGIVMLLTVVADATADTQLQVVIPDPILKQTHVNKTYPTRPTEATTYHIGNYNVLLDPSLLRGYLRHVIYNEILPDEITVELHCVLNGEHKVHFAKAEEFLWDILNDSGQSSVYLRFLGLSVQVCSYEEVQMYGPSGNNQF
jgi:hypothetical protein